MAQARALTVVAAGGAVRPRIRDAHALQFPGIWTILVINVLGSLLLGILAAVLGPDRLWRLFLGVGVLGGFTTFSTFAVDVVQHPGSAVVYILATLLPALAAARIGMALGDEWHSRRRAQA